MKTKNREKHIFPFNFSCTFVILFYLEQNKKRKTKGKTKKQMTTAQKRTYEAISNYDKTNQHFFFVRSL